MTETSLYFIVSIVLLIRMVIIEKKISSLNDLSQKLAKYTILMDTIHQIHDTRITNIEKVLNIEPTPITEQTIK
jgi:hypothetical protein